MNRSGVRFPVPAQSFAPLPATIRKDKVTGSAWVVAKAALNVHLVVAALVGQPSHDPLDGPRTEIRMVQLVTRVVRRQRLVPVGDSTFQRPQPGHGRERLVAADFGEIILIEADEGRARVVSERLQTLRPTPE